MKTKKQRKNFNLSGYFKKYKFGISLYVISSIIASGCDILFTISFARAIEFITLAQYKSAIITLFVVCGLVVLRRIGYYFSTFFYQKYANRIMADLNLDLAKQAFKLNSKTYNDHDTGTFVQRIINDPERVVSSLADIMDNVFEIISSLIMIIYISTLNIYIGIAIVGLILIGILIEIKRTKVRRKNRWLTRRKNDVIHSLTTEIVRSEKDIKSLGLEDKLSEVSKNAYEDYKKTSYHTEIVDLNFYASRNLLIDVASILILVLGVVMIDRGLLTLASFMIVYSNRGNLYSFVWGLGHIANLWADIKVSSDRMFAIFDDKEFVCERFGSKHIENIKGQIEFKKVAYTFYEYEYKENANYKKEMKDRYEKVLVSQNQIFNNLSFKIEPNTTVAFVGRSGSGKSTILNLMSKMYEVDDGQVLLDGININDFDKESLRNSISLVNQFPYIFDMTIRENLLLAKKDASDSELDNAILKASLKDFIDTLPKGIDNKVGESGTKLSGGQKQRLAIARALLRNSPIIIFDESTSSLDNFAQEEIKHSIDSLKGKSTIVIVAHRLSTIRNVDKIFFLENGKIEDIGTFDELFENNVKFKNMFFAENIE